MAVGPAARPFSGVESSHGRIKETGRGGGTRRAGWLAGWLYLTYVFLAAGHLHNALLGLISFVFGHIT